MFCLLLIGCNIKPHVHEFIDGKCECGEVDIEVYTVIFKDFDGVVLSEVIVEKGQDAPLPDSPTRDGYNFIGWDKEVNNIQQDLEVIACYEKIVNKAKTAKEWLNEIKFGINYFNGINENNDNDAYFKWIKDQGFNAVEIGCRYADLVESVYGEINIVNVTKLKEIIDLAYKYELYIILSLYDGYEYMWTSLNPDNE